MTKRKAPKTRNHGEFTETQMKAYIVALLRKKSVQWKPAAACLKNSRNGKIVNPLSGRMVNAHECAHCRELFTDKQIVADHINPVVSVDGFDSWDNFIARLFVEVDGFQALCKPCHQIKSNAENKLRAANKKKRIAKEKMKDDLFNQGEIK